MLFKKQRAKEKAAASVCTMTEMKVLFVQELFMHRVQSTLVIRLPQNVHKLEE